MRISPTDPELDVMAVFRELGSATGAEVRERLPDELAYTTVLTVPRRLGAKSYVAHEEAGRAHGEATRPGLPGVKGKGRAVQPPRLAQ